MDTFTLQAAATFMLYRKGNSFMPKPEQMPRILPAELQHFRFAVCSHCTATEKGAGHQHCTGSYVEDGIGYRCDCPQHETDEQHTGLRFSTAESKPLAVMLGETCVAVAKSGTYARRIANALNLYTPGRRGF